MYTYGRFMLRCDRKQQNCVKQLSFNLKIKKHNNFSTSPITPPSESYYN